MARGSKAAGPAEDSNSKKARLTIAQLAAYDDVLTDVLVDHVFAWHHVRKNLDQWQVRNYKYSRGVSGEDITKILFEDIVLNKNPARALDRILQLSALKKYYSLLPSDRERNDFRRHAAKYINIWLPDCAFEVSFTNRYMLDQWEAKTTARKLIKTGERIKYLCGELVQISLEEQDDEKFIENAFSITYSSRRKTPSLFLGPARFSNHDCNANAKLESRGSEGMLVIAVRDIEVGDEINVHYGDNYFGEDNCECLCASCEKYGQGAWQYGTEERGAHTPRAGSEEANDPGSRRSKRKRNIVDYKQRLREANTRMEEEHPSKRRKADVEYNGRAEEWTPTPETREPPRKLNSKQKVKPVPKTPTKSVDARTASMLALTGRSEMPSKSPAAIKGEFNRSPFGRRLGFSNSPNSAVRTRRSSSSSGGGGPPKNAYYKSHMLFAFLQRKRVDEGNRNKPDSSTPPMTTLPSVEVDLEHSQDSPESSEEASVFDVSNGGRQSASPITEPPSAEENADDHSDSIGDDDVYSADRIETPKIPKVPLRQIRMRNGQITDYTNPQDVVELETNSRDPRERKLKLRDGHIVSVASLVKDADGKNLVYNPSLDNHNPPPAKRTLPGALTRTSEPVQPIAVTELTTAKSTGPQTPEPPITRNKTPASPIQSKANTAHRIPGDYYRTTRLLGPKNSRWIDCRTCDDVFLQFDSDQTRRECPRCERHSKLYGFQWPQTDYEKGDGAGTQKRVMDHRTVNRFLSRAEEAELSKKGRGEGVDGEKGSRPSSSRG